MPTNEELLAKMKQIEGDPASKLPPGSWPTYTKKATKKLEAIAAEIAHNMAMKRAAEGNPVPCDGYSGRKQNKRR